jgi:multidrug resistance efflux pump
MIAFLTLIYCAFLFGLIKLKIIKASPLAYGSIGVWVLLLLIVLFIPMQFFAPSGPVRVFSYVLQIVPNVGGQVIEVPIQANTPIEKGAVLFRIDPRPYQFTVDRLEAVLASTGVSVSQLTETVRSAEAVTAMARANLLATETDMDQRARQRVEAARAQVAGTLANLEVARADFTRVSQAAESEAVSRAQLDAARRQVETLEAQLDAGSDRIRQARDQVDQARANEQSARLAYEAEIGGVNPAIKQVLADLETARLNLEWTTVRAPVDGYAVNLQLRPGFRVAALPMSPVMSLVDTERKVLAGLIRQTQARWIQPGQEAEVVLDLYPGKTFSATVDYLIKAQGQGQMTPSGQLPVGNPTEGNAPFFVRLEMQDFPDDLDLLVGAGGSVAIYTEYGTATHLIRRVMMRMQSWLNYIM